MEGAFLHKWAEAAYTSLGFFWMALWAFALGYLISSLIQVFVTEKKMKEAMDSGQTKGILLGTFFGFISSSCSFAALATTKSLFKKGASFLSSLAFLLASTNLVIELGIIISIFLGWQFVVGEYVGGVLLIAICWVLVAIIKPEKLIRQARDHLNKLTDKSMGMDMKENSREIKWAKVSRQYGMEWKMVWKDVTFGFTVAGIVAAFVPDAFFETLFIHASPGKTHFSFPELLEHTVVGPIAAFLTFIGSMGNIPLAALLFTKGVSFAGVIAFIFSDLVVFPVLRINAKYYGWKMSLFILGLLFSALVITSLILHYAFAGFDMLPKPGEVNIMETSYFEMNYTFWLNLAFVVLSGVLLWFGYIKHKGLKYMKEMAPKSKLLERLLWFAAMMSYAWLTIGILLYFFL